MQLSEERRQKLEEYQCPMEACISMIGGKYKVIILYHLMGEGVLRYSQIARAIPKATPKMLSQQLKELENDGIIKRTLYPVVPPKTEYSLTPLGERIRPVIESLVMWSNIYYEEFKIEHKKIGQQVEDGLEDS